MEANNEIHRGGEQVFDRDEFSHSDIFGVLIESRWLIGGIVTIVVLIGLLYTVLATPIYKADGMIQVEEKKSGVGDLDINAIFEGDTSINAEIEILRSRLVLGTVVDNLKLDIQSVPNYFPLFGKSLSRWAPQDEKKSIRVDSLELPDFLVGEDLTLIALGQSQFELLGPDDESLVAGTVGETATSARSNDGVSIFVSELRSGNSSDFNVRRTTRLKSIEQLQRTLRVREKGKGSGILSISIEGEDPDVVEEIVNEIANVYVRKNVERRSEEAEKTLSFLDEQLPAVKQDMETAEVALNTYRLEKGSVDLPLETQAVLETIVHVEGQLNSLKQERDKITQGFTAAHPMVIGLDKQIDRLAVELSELNEQVRQLPDTQQEVLRLVRDTQVNTELYTSLLNTAQELRVVKAGTVGNVRIVDYAATPYRPIKPNKPLLMILFLLFGGLIGVASAFLKKFLMGGVEDPDLIESEVHLPVYATVAHSKRQDALHKRMQSGNSGEAILASDSPDDLAIESLRNLRTTLQFAMMDVPNNCIMIAGPSPGVGKSFVSVNLASILADSNKKVLLIDGDMRRGHLHQFFGLARENGLSEFVSGEISIDDALHATTVPGLSLIPTGKIPPNPSELLLHQRFSACIADLGSQFDHIIIDSPPVLAVTDASIIGQVAGATLMVLKSGQHPMREIQQAIKRLRQAGVNLRGLMVNDQPFKGSRYGAGKYAYQYSYEKV